MLTKPDAKCPQGNILTGRDATARFIELLASNQNATMKWHVSRTSNLEEAFYCVQGTHNSLRKRLEKDQRADRNVGLRIGSYKERGQWHSAGAVYLEFQEEYSEGYVDFHLHPDFIVCAPNSCWTAYWLTTESDSTKLRELRHALAQHYEQKTTRYAYARPVPGFLWHDDGCTEEVTLVDFMGKSLGDETHFEGLHTLDEMYAGLAKNAELHFLKDDPAWGSERNFDPLANDEAAKNSESYFSSYLDGERDTRPIAAELISNFLPEDSLYMLYGPTGSFKTFVMLDVAYSAASGRDLWPSHDTPSSDITFCVRDCLKIVFIAGEGQSDFQRRVTAWKKHHGITKNLDVLILEDMPRFDNQAQLKALVKDISNKIGYADILVIDTVMEASVGFNISDPANSRDFIYACKYLRRHLLCSICLIHHTGKDHKGHLGAEHLKASMDVLDKVEAKSCSGAITTLQIVQEKNRDQAKRRKLLLEAIPIEIGRDTTGSPVTSLALRRKAGQDAIAPDHNAGFLKVALSVLEDAKGTGKMSIQDLIAEIVSRSRPDLIGDARKREAERLRKAVSGLAKDGGLSPYATRGPGKTSPWQFEISDSSNAIAAE